MAGDLTKIKKKRNHPEWQNNSYVRKQLLNLEQR